MHEAGGRLIVFGSLVEGRFHERSDIDVAVCGLPEGVDSDVALDVDIALRRAGFSADVIAERFLSPSLKERIDRNGRPAEEVLREEATADDKDETRHLMSAPANAERLMRSIASFED